MTDSVDAVEPVPRVLIVDDEPSILNAMKRLFRGKGIEVFTAGSGREGLELLEKTSVDLVISDMRMPEMDGAQFLEAVFSRWQETKRILLTGYSEAESTIAAINRGKIWCYVSKPWSDNDLLNIVHQALAHRHLVRQNIKLTELTLRQNEELKQLNAGLEQIVASRTSELQAANTELRQSFLSMVQVFSNLIEQREGRVAGHSRRVADLALQLAERLGFDESEQRNVLLASLLHDIGKVGMPDRLIGRAFNALSAGEKQELMLHPEKGQQILAGIPQLHEAGRIIRHHHECMDGSGFPDQLGGLMIPLSSRILAVANDFYELQSGLLTLHQYSATKALEYMVKQRGKRYDPTIVDALAAIHTESTSLVEQEAIVTPLELKPGMVLTCDLLHVDGSVFLPKGRVIDANVASQLIRMQETMSDAMLIHVRQCRGPSMLRSRVESTKARNRKEMALGTTQLKEGMKLSRSLFHPGGYLLLAHGNYLDSSIIRQLRVMEKFTGKQFVLHIQMNDR